MVTRTVQVGHVSDLAGEREIREFFSFSGEIEHIEIQSGFGQPKTAFVTFKDSKALEIALLLSGATIVDQIVSITPVENYVPKVEEVRDVDNANSAATTESVGLNVETKITSPGNGREYVTKAQGAVTNILAKGSAIGQEALNKAKAFDEKHQFTANASAKVISFDRRVGLTEKLTVGISVVNDKVKSVDQRLQVSDKTMAALVAAERKLNDTGSAVKTSRFSIAMAPMGVMPILSPCTCRLSQPALAPFQYVTAGAAWFNDAFSKVAKVGQVAGTKTKEKFELAVSNLTARDSLIAA
ncbi:Binding partner of acd11 [Thalictrum thalictroides]|uniref:Binding partner of acd11 n=1 Tax=Thalictrum thalictroides TaxID=46969 RepID=A0A7J6VRH7_THATH|nr:Binding partner of acd11 [Thalictrum thalictroides]